LTSSLNVCRQFVSMVYRGEGLLLTKLGGGARLASQTPYPIYDQNLQYPLPYLWPDQNFYTLFVAWPLNGNLIYDQNGWKAIPFGAAHIYITHIREYPPPRIVMSSLFKIVRKTRSNSRVNTSEKFRLLEGMYLFATWGPFLESPGNFSGQ